LRFEVLQPEYNQNVLGQPKELAISFSE